jgi:hypothetical protein|tara:strand:- start:1708 stop:2292 length:585 start_codon:yes stop_codon:yes gene_type:complete
MVASSEDVNAMKKAMNALNKPVVAPSASTETSTGKPIPTSKFSSPDVEAMNIIMEKFNNAADIVAEEVLEIPTKQGVRMGLFEITVDKVPFGKKNKNYYNIVDIYSGKTLYKNLALFESAITITKNLLNENDRPKQQLIAEIDQKYANALIKAGQHKRRIRTAPDNSTKQIFEAKYTETLHKARTAKGEIKQLI